MDGITDPSLPPLRRIGLFFVSWRHLEEVVLVKRRVSGGYGPPYFLDLPDIRDTGRSMMIVYACAALRPICTFNAAMVSSVYEIATLTVRWDVIADEEKCELHFFHVPNARIDVVNGETDADGDPCAIAADMFDTAIAPKLDLMTVHPFRQYLRNKYLLDVPRLSDQSQARSAAA